MIKFLSDYREAIQEEFLKHKETPGFIFVQVDKDFQPVEHFTFMPREINPDLYINLFDDEGEADYAKEGARWMFYEIYWASKRVTWRLKEIVHPDLFLSNS